MQTHTARTRLPFGTSTMATQAGKFLPTFAAVGRAENGGVLHASVNRAGIFERWLQVPHPLELPRMLCAVVKLMGGEWLAGLGRCVVDKLVARLCRPLWQRFTGWRSRLVPVF